MCSYGWYLELFPETVLSSLRTYWQQANFGTANNFMSWGNKPYIEQVLAKAIDELLSSVLCETVQSFMSNICTIGVVHYWLR